jgi:hypothetical protein
MTTKGKETFHVLQRSGYLGNRKPCTNCGKCGEVATLQDEPHLLPGETEKVPEMTKEELSKLQKGVADEGGMLPTSLNGGIFDRQFADDNTTGEPPLLPNLE